MQCCVRRLYSKTLKVVVQNWAQFLPPWRFCFFARVAGWLVCQLDDTKTTERISSKLRTIMISAQNRPH